MKIQNRRLFALVCLLLAFTMMLSVPPALAEEVSGKPEIITNGDFQYVVGEDGTASIHTYKGSASDVTVPAVLDGHPVTGIGDFAFGHHSNGPASITVPEGVTTIGKYAFSINSNLTAVSLPASVISIGRGAFSGCIRLGVIEVAEGNPQFASIDGVLFDRASKTLLIYPTNKSTSSYEIPAGTLSIAAGALSRCNRLISVSVPASVTSVGLGALTACRLLKTIDVAQENPAYVSADGVLFDKAMSALLAYPCAKDGSSYEVPAGVAAIGRSAFAQCQRLTSIILPDGLTAIGNSAFSGCGRLASIEIPDSVTSIPDAAFYGCGGLISFEIPGGVTSISDAAFYFCKGLTSVSIPASVTSIGDDAFSECSNLREITVSGDNSVYASVDGVLFTKSTKILKCSPPARSVTGYEIPEGTTAIAYHAFSGNDNLKSVVIPSGVMSIGDYAFDGCYHLTSITIPDSVTSIGEGAFSEYNTNFHITLGSYAEDYLIRNGLGMIYY